ncbi:MAG: hypothetical protein PHR35_09500 [Kiritimatiellae bacterium]|nr:hypothetical protein [Kiritimatiellia bacterium]
MKTEYRYERIPNWALLRERYLAFWNKQVLDRRPLLQIQNPNPAAPPPPPRLSSSQESDWTTYDRFRQRREWGKAQWNWHTDLFQYTTPSAFGPMSFLAFCCVQPVFDNNTVWYNPAIRSLDQADAIHFDPDSRYWRLFLELLEACVDDCAGKQQIAIPVDGSPLDWIAHALGTENMLFAVIEQPEALHRFAMRLATEYLQAYDSFYPLLTSRNDGVCNWLPVWSDRPLISLQDDLAINVSPQAYQDIFLPALRRMAAHAERASLHWHDGARQHSDWIAAVPEIDLVQWGHDPASPPFRAALPHMQKLQAAGKRLFISCVAAEDAAFFLDNLEPGGLIMIVDAADDAESLRLEQTLRV